MTKSWFFGFLFFLSMMILGYYAGEIEHIYDKAIKICLECIGIG